MIESKNNENIRKIENRVSNEEARAGKTSSMQSVHDGMLLEREVKDNLISVLMIATPVTMLLISSPLLLNHLSMSS